MRMPGLWEIILVIAIIVIAVVAARIFRGRRIARRDNEVSEGGSAVNSSVQAPGPRRIVRRTGFAGIAVGILLLLASITLVQAAFKIYPWALAVIIIGGILVFLTRKKR